MLLPRTQRSVTRLAGAVAICLLAATSTFRAGAPTASPTRALWVTRTTLTSPEAIAQMVKSAEAAGFNTLLVQVRGRGDAYFSSSLEPRAEDLTARPAFDPLATTLDLAHAAGLKVHAWVAVNLVSSAVGLPASRDHIVYRSPEWLMVPRELAPQMRGMDVRSPAYLGRLARWTRAHATEVEGLYTSPIQPAAAAHTAAVIGELVTRYAVDGVHLDYARYPNEAFDYSAASIAAFKASVLPTLSPRERQDIAAREALDPLAYPDAFHDRWSDFRRSRLTALVMRIRTAIQTARPNVAVSAAVVPDAQVAYATRLQDWRTWIDQSLLDILCPMAYTSDPDVFAQQVGSAKEYAGDRPVWAGIGAYRLTPAQTLQHIAAANRLGAAGIILFSYDALVAPPNTAESLTEIGRAAFGAGPE